MTEDDTYSPERELLRRLPYDKLREAEHIRKLRDKLAGGDDE